MSIDKSTVKVIYRGNSLFCKQTSLINKYVQIDLALTKVLMSQVEVDIVKDRYKVYEKAPLRLNRPSSINTMQTNEKNGNTE